jgi:hypothetical protein
MQCIHVRVIALVVLCSFLLSTSAVHAQQPPEPGPPSPATPGPASPDENAPFRVASRQLLSRAIADQTFAPFMVDAAARERIAGRQIPTPVVTALYTGLATTQALDVHSTLRAIDGGSREANAAMRWATKHPATFIGIKAATTAGTLYLIDRMRPRHPKAALFLLVALNSASAIVVAHNYRASPN